MNTNEIMELVQINREISRRGVQTLVPCFIGRSGSGKTTRANTVSKMLFNKAPEIVLLHSTLAEEVLGMPKLDKSKNLTIWTDPNWVDFDAPKLYFFDELDKVRQEELGAILTLFADKKVRNKTLPADSVIIAGMQPVPVEAWQESETGQALISRLLFIPVRDEETHSYLGAKYGLALDYIKKINFEIPTMPTPNGRQLEYFIVFSQIAGIEKAKKYCRYMFHDEILNALAEELSNKSFTIDKRAIVERLNKDIKKVADFDIYQLIDMIGEIWHHGSSELISEATALIIERGTFDEYSKMVEGLYNYLSNIIGDGETLEIANGDSEEKFFQVFEERMEQLKKKMENDKK